MAYSDFVVAAAVIVVMYDDKLRLSYVNVNVNVNVNAKNTI